MIWPLMMMLAAVDPGAVDADERLVIVGRDAEDFGTLDACGGLGRVVKLDPRGDNFLSVRKAPSAKARAKDRVAAGQELWLCDDDATGEWLGVVYAKPGDANQDCGVSTPANYTGAYRGPCRYGWVNRRFVEMIAG